MTPRLALLVACEGTLHFDAVAVVGGDEVVADEHEDDVGAVKVRVDFAGPIVARLYLPVVPFSDDALPL